MNKFLTLIIWQVFIKILIDWNRRSHFFTYGNSILFSNPQIKRLISKTLDSEFIMKELHKSLFITFLNTSHISFVQLIHPLWFKPRMIDKPMFNRREYIYIIAGFIWHLSIKICNTQRNALKIYAIVQVMFVLKYVMNKWNAWRQIICCFLCYVWMIRTIW